MLNELQAADLPEDMSPEGNVPSGWVLKKLTERHKSICSLLAQGMPQVDIATITGVTPQYIHMLTKQPLVMQYVQSMSVVAGVRLEAMFSKTVDTIAEVMQTGNGTEKLKAARLQAEITGRVGSKNALPNESPAEDRLNKLADRLTGLLSQAKQISGDVHEEAIEGQFSIQPVQSGQRSGEAAQEDGTGDHAGQSQHSQFPEEE
jgi:hypothetical protein